MDRDCCACAHTKGMANSRETNTQFILYRKKNGSALPFQLLSHRLSLTQYKNKLQKTDQQQEYARRVRSIYCKDSQDASSVAMRIMQSPACAGKTNLFSIRTIDA